MVNFFFGGSLGGKSGGVVGCGGTALAPLLRHSHTAPPRSIPARRRRVLSNYSALSLYNGNKGKTKPHDASNTREQFESSLRTGFADSLSLNRRRVIAFGKLAGGRE